MFKKASLLEAFLMDLKILLVVLLKMAGCLKRIASALQGAV